MQAVGFTALWIGAVFFSAGRLNWIRGWIYLGLLVVAMATAEVVMRRCNPSLFTVRASWRRSDAKPFDKAFLSVFFPLTFIQPAVAGLDAVRYGWSSMPSVCVYPGLVLFSGAIVLQAWALAVNPYAERTVRIQTDRGHTVIASGPYQFVRHPIYAAAILMYVATPLILGSVWIFAVTGVIVALFIWRTTAEDRTLRAELVGYTEYAAHTRYRLLPKVW